MKHFISRHKLFFALQLLFFVLVLSCTTIHAHNISPQAEKYLHEVITLLKKESIHKNTITWHKFKDDVFLVAKNSRTIKDTYPAVSYAVSLLRDHHSYFEQAIQKNRSAEEKPLPILNDEKTPTGVGYVRIPFCIGDESHLKQYIKIITDKIDRQNNPEIKGWIIDLRDNFGGNMWPMMAAIGSFLDTGIQGYFIDADNKSVAWRHEYGKVYADTNVLAEYKHNFALYGKKNMAVLINHKTASSGEAMAVLLKGYSHIKFFGAATFGVSTGCKSFSLSDGSRINLATSIFADRNRRKYGKSIIPDFNCVENESLSTAINWIIRKEY